jgi:hypothetical protein
MRIWLSFPRILDGLVRPGISFNSSELTRLLHRGRVVVKDWRRGDLVVSRRGSQDPGHRLDMTVDLSFDARARVAEGARLEPTPPRFPEYPLRDRIAAWVILGFALWVFISMVGCVISVAHAGTCRYYSDGSDSVVACDNGAYTVTDSHGRKRIYGPGPGLGRSTSAAIAGVRAALRSIPRDGYGDGISRKEARNRNKINGNWRILQQLDQRCPYRYAYVINERICYPLNNPRKTVAQESLFQPVDIL